MRTIESPGVEIREIDLSLSTQLPVGTTVLAVGYAAQGPTDELVNVTSINELENIYGEPTNAAERYFYHTCKQILEANATLLVTRLPYGSGSGNGFTDNYSALIFPVFPYTSDTTALTYPAGSAIAAQDVTLYTFSASQSSAILSGTFNYYAAVSASDFAGDVSLSALPFSLNSLVSGDGTLPDVEFVYLSATNALSANHPAWSGTLELVASDLTNDTYNWSLSTSYTFPITGGTFDTHFSYLSASQLGPSNLDDAEYFYLGQPVHMVVDNETYLQWIQGGINWKNSVTSGFQSSRFCNLSAVGYAGMVIVNEAKTSIDQQFAGYYIALADNSKLDKGSNFDSTNKMKTINNTVVCNEWLELSESRLAFPLSGTYTQKQGSISEVVESVPSFDFAATGPGGYTDSIVVALFRVRPTLYNADDRVLDYVLLESHIGSFDSTRTINNPNGGNPYNFYLEDVVNDNSRNMRVLINPHISQQGGPWYDAQDGSVLKQIRVMASARTNENSTITTDPAEPQGKAGVALEATVASGTNYMANADHLYGVGEYVSCLDAQQKMIGNLPLKLERALDLAENREMQRVDIVPEGGLGTVWTGMRLDMNNWPTNATNPITFSQTDQRFDDTRYVNGILNAHTFDADSEGLYDQATGSSSEAQDLYETVWNVFNNFCESTRRDCLYVADPLRYIFVQGIGDIRVLDDRTKNFSQHIFWPLKNLYGAANSSYSCTYANWFKSNDKTSSKAVWLPPSGYLARIMTNVDTNQYPWFAPAGLNRGILRDVIDIGINPTQRQRDLLYKNGINPTVYWPGDGYVVWGQKTQLTKPSAFDRINVRRLFFWLEKATLQIMRYYVFEQNTVFTRERVKTSLSPIFEFARNNEGVYDYLIVCDERNNTPEVIDRNELIVDIYIKPVRVAEYILVNFIATRTGQDFSELL